MKNIIFIILIKIINVHMHIQFIFISLTVSIPLQLTRHRSVQRNKRNNICEFKNQATSQFIRISYTAEELIDAN